MTRRLASIRRVSRVDPIDGADNIVRLTIDGWELVSQKGNFAEGDLAIYFEIDSFLPVREEFEFLRSRCFKSTKNLGDGFRLKTIKLRGQVSQGLALPVREFIEQEVSEGGDVTELLGVQLYEKPIPSNLQGRVRGNFPSFIPKTDQDRIQNCNRTHERKSLGEVFEMTLKLDGSSMTVYYNDGLFGVCSRNMDLLEDETNLFWQMANKLNLRDVLTSYGKNIALQGELMGPGVQGNREGFKEHKFFLFDVWGIDRQEYLNSYDRASLYKSVLADSGMDHAPLLTYVIPFMEDNILDIAGFQTLADIESINHKVAEGVVFKSVQDPSKSFKCISNRFLLSEKD